MENPPTRPKSRKPVVFRDGLGKRARTLDAAGTELEVLCLRPELSTAAAEAALRDRVQRLANFRSGAFAKVRSVQRLNDAASTLALVSAATPGLRLSDLLHTAARLEVPLDGSAGWALLMQLASAMAHLHEHAPDVAHGTLAPERIVLTPDARVMVVEHVLSGVLETLKWPQAQYWREQRIASPASGRPLDLRADVIQLGIVALSVVHGRSLRDDEYPGALAELVESASLTSVTGGREPMNASLRLWLDRTLQLDDRRSFSSAIEASAELHQLLAESDSVVVPLALESFLARVQKAIDRDKQAPTAPRAAHVAAGSTTTPPARETLASSDLPVDEPPPAGMPVAPPAVEPITQVPRRVANPALQSFLTAPDAVPFDARYSAPERPSSQWREKAWSRQAIAAAFLTVVCGVGWVAASRLFADDAPPTAAKAAAPPVVTPPTPPAETTSTTATSMEPVEPASTEISQTLPAAPSQPAPAPAPAAAAAPTPAPAAGWVTIRASHDLNVFENGALLGTTRGGRIALPPGAHVLELASDELGYRSTENVQVRSGAEAKLAVTLPNGSLSLNATPWAEVFVDGRSVGETPIGNLAVAAGTHEIVFRHPELGEQRMTAVVTVNGPTRLSADLRRQP